VRGGDYAAFFLHPEYIKLGQLGIMLKRLVLNAPPVRLPSKGHSESFRWKLLEAPEFHRAGLLLCGVVFGQSSSGIAECLGRRLPCPPASVQRSISSCLILARHCLIAGSSSGVIVRPLN
jgi:hypothetical protein